MSKLGEKVGVHNICGTFDENDVVWNILRMKENQGSVVVTRNEFGYHWRPLRPEIETQNKPEEKPK